GRVCPAGGVTPERFKTVGRVCPAGVLKERSPPGGRVRATAYVVKKRIKTDRRIVVTGCVVVERFKPIGGVIDARRDAEKRILTLSCVEAGIASVRRRADRLCHLRKRKARKHERNE